MENNNVLPEGHESLMTLDGKHFTATRDGVEFSGKVIAKPEYAEVYLDNDTFDVGEADCEVQQDFNYLIYLCEGDEWALDHREISNFRITD